MNDLGYTLISKIIKFHFEKIQYLIFDVNN